MFVFLFSCNIMISYMHFYFSKQGLKVVDANGLLLIYIEDPTMVVCLSRRHDQTKCLFAVATIQYFVWLMFSSKESCVMFKCRCYVALCELFIAYCCQDKKYWLVCRKSVCYLIISHFILMCFADCFKWLQKYILQWISTTDTHAIIVYFIFLYPAA